MVHQFDVKRQLTRGQNLKNREDELTGGRIEEKLLFSIPAAIPRNGMNSPSA